ncbi:V-type ATP synthase subunit I [Candidatus Woesearchaeota archaeon]|nr:V-type ATP synthase subunit I [Candidatus Woesearchaeota archaeon]
MLRTKELSKVALYVTESNLKAMIDELHSLKVYHIVTEKDFWNGSLLKNGNPVLETPSPLARAEHVSEALNKINAVLSFLAIPKQEITSTKETLKEQKPARDDNKQEKYAAEKEIAESIARVEKLYTQTSFLLEQKKKLSTTEGEINQQLLTLTPFKESIVQDASLGMLVETMSSQATKANAPLMIIGSIKEKNSDEFKKELTKIAKALVIWTGNDPTGNGTPVVIITLQKYKEKIEKAIAPYTFTPLDLQGYIQEQASLRGAIETLEQAKSQLNKDLADINQQKEEIKKSVTEIIRDNTILTRELEKLEAPLLFRKTKRVYCVKGFVPSDKLMELRRRLKERIGNAYYLEDEAISRKKDAPVLLENPGAVKPFEMFLNLYALPKYSEIDPSMITFLTFPLIFGAMLGDIGYGIITLLIFLVMKKFVPQIKGFLNILILASLWTILFGVVFGEFFGTEVILGYELHPYIHRLEDINQLLVFAIIIGIVHINIGLILGFINEYRMHGFKAAFLEKASWMLLQIGAGAIGYGIYADTSIFPGIIIVIVSAVLIYAGEGVKGLVELPGIFSNILSYARIMAIGLSSAALAVVINEFAAELFHQGIGGIIGGILLLLVGHFINILLGLLGPFLHSLRLHYVEMFSKFYKGGGKPFHPFGIEE